MVDDVESRLDEWLTANLERARAGHDTPVPQVRDLWRARWADHAGAVLVTGIVPGPLSGGTVMVRVEPVTIGGVPDDSAVLVPAAAHDLGFDMTVWVEEATVVPIRVLERRLGSVRPAADSFPRGSANKGPRDPRTRERARIQDLMDTLRYATWVPATNPKENVASLLRPLALPDVVAAVGSLPVAMQLVKGTAPLTADQAERLAPLLARSADDLLRANPPIPADLVTHLDQPAMRRRVQQLAARRHEDEVSAWQAAAYGVLAVAAREYDRAGGPSWEGRVAAFLATALPDDPSAPAGGDETPGGDRP